MIRRAILLLISRRTDVTNMDVLTKSFSQVERDFGQIDNWYVKFVSSSSQLIK